MQRSLCSTPSSSSVHCEQERERDVLCNNALNTFYLRLYGVGHMVKDHSDSEKGNLLPPHGLLLSINSKVLLYAPSHRQDSTYHSLCYTSHGALAGTRNSSMGPPHEGSIRRPIAPWANALTTELHPPPSHRQDNTYHNLCYTSRGAHWLEREIAQWVHPMKDRSDDPSHHEQTLLPRSYISLLSL